MSALSRLQQNNSMFTAALFRRLSLLIGIALAIPSPASSQTSLPAASSPFASGVVEAQSGLSDLSEWAAGDASGLLSSNYYYNDPESLLTGISYKEDAQANVALAYDGYGRMDSMQDGSGTRTVSFDDLDEVTGATSTAGGAQSIGYLYYPDGSRSAMSTSAGVYSYGY
ncbi:MAG TPA: hypothetical protein VGS41_05925, partial [Chthonomonadales bacterium]|nr:hypothetical protein [Chthonomonadales bacterium]